MTANKEDQLKISNFCKERKLPVEADDRLKKIIDNNPNAKFIRNWTEEEILKKINRKSLDKNI